MLTQIDVQCDNPFFMSVLGANPRDSLILQKVTGLGPSDVSLFMGEYSRDGGIYTGRRTTARNPVMYIKINPNFANGESVDGWRDILYRAFMDPFANGDDVTIILRDDVRPDRMLTGYTEKFEGEVFDKDTDVQISMICPDPFIRDVTPTIVVPPEGVPGWQQVPFSYSGTAKTGFKVRIALTAATTTLTLDNNGQTMILTYAFLEGDVVNINTKPGERSITITRGAATSDILYTLYSESPWLQLHSQSNTLKVYGEAPVNIVANINRLEFTQLYRGA